MLQIFKNDFLFLENKTLFLNHTSNQPLNLKNKIKYFCMLKVVYKKLKILLSYTR